MIVISALHRKGGAGQPGGEEMDDETVERLPAPPEAPAQPFALQDLDEDELREIMPPAAAPQAQPKKKPQPPDMYENRHHRMPSLLDEKDIDAEVEDAYEDTLLSDEGENRIEDPENPGLTTQSVKSYIADPKNAELDAWAKKFADLYNRGQSDKASAMAEDLKAGRVSFKIATATGKTVDLREYVSTALQKAYGVDRNRKDDLAMWQEQSQGAANEKIMEYLFKYARDVKKDNGRPFSALIKQVYAKNTPTPKALSKLKKGMVDEDGQLFSYDFVRKKYPTFENESSVQKIETKGLRTIESYKWKNWEYLDSDPEKLAALEKDPECVRIGEPSAPGAPASRVYEAARAFNSAYETLSEYQHWIGENARQQAIAAGKNPGPAAPRLPALTIEPEEGKSGDGCTVTELKKQWASMHTADGTLADVLSQFKAKNSKGEQVDYTHYSKYWIMNQVIQRAIDVQEKGNGGSYPAGRLLAAVNNWAKQNGYDEVPSLDRKEWSKGGKYWFGSEIVNPSHEHISVKSLYDSLVEFKNRKGMQGKTVSIDAPMRGGKSEGDSAAGTLQDKQKQTNETLETVAPDLMDPMLLLGRPFRAESKTPQDQKTFFTVPLMRDMLAEYYKHELKLTDPKQAAAVAKKAAFMYEMVNMGKSLDEIASIWVRFKGDEDVRPGALGSLALQESIMKEKAMFEGLWRRMNRKKGEGNGPDKDKPGDIERIKEIYDGMTNTPKLLNLSKDVAKTKMIEQQRREAFFKESEELDEYYADEIDHYKDIGDKKKQDEYRLRRLVNETIRTRLQINYLDNEGSQFLIPENEIKAYMEKKRVPFKDAVAALAARHPKTMGVWLTNWKKAHDHPPTFEDMVLENQRRAASAAYAMRTVTDKNLKEIEALSTDKYFRKPTAYEMERKIRLTPKQRLAKLVYDTSAQIITKLFAKELAKPKATASSFAEYVRMVRTAQFLIIESIRKAA